MFIALFIICIILFYCVSSDFVIQFYHIVYCLYYTVFIALASKFVILFYCTVCSIDYIVTVVFSNFVFQFLCMYYSVLLHCLKIVQSALGLSKQADYQ